MLSRIFGFGGESPSLGERLGTDEIRRMTTTQNISNEQKTGDIQWDHKENIKISSLDKCIKNIFINNFIANGAYGLVYNILYEDKVCALKLIPIETTPMQSFTMDIDPLYAFTKIDKFIMECETVKKLSNKKLAPKMYKYGTCDVKFYQSKKKYDLTVGYIISEKYDITLSDLQQEMVTRCILDIEQDPLKYQTIIFKYTDYFLKIDRQIDKDLEKAFKLGISNSDIHINNIMIKEFGNKMIAKIVDWGISKNSVSRRIDKYREESPTYGTLGFLEHLKRMLPENTKTSQLIGLFIETIMNSMVVYQ